MSVQAMEELDRPLPWFRAISIGQWGILLGVWSAWLLDAFDFLLLTFVLRDVGNSFHVSLHTASLLLLATFGVRWLGGLLFGSISDRFGRKMPLIVAVCWFSLGAGLTGLAWNFGSILAFRLFLGFGMAPIFALGSTIVAESWPPRYRAAGIGILDSGWAFGGMLAALTYALVYPSFGWRALFFVGMIPGLILAILLVLLLPNTGKPARGVPGLTGNRQNAAVQLFREHLPLVIALGLMEMLMQFGSWPLQGLLPTFLRGVQFSPSSVAALSTTVAIGQIVGFTGSGFLAEAIGRRNAIASSLVLGCLALALLVLFYQNPALRYLLGFMSGVFLIGASGIYSTIIAENLPASVRATGVGFLYNIGVIGGGMAPFVVLAVRDRFQIPIAIGIISFTVVGELLGIAIMYSKVPETRGRQIDTLEVA